MPSPGWGMHGPGDLVVPAPAAASGAVLGRREHAEQLGLRSLLVCMLRVSSCTRAAGTWPVPCVQLILGGLCDVQSVAKGSGNVDVFQCNHTEPTTTSPAPAQACAVSPCGEGAAGLGGAQGQRFVLTGGPCSDPWVL